MKAVSIRAVATVKSGREVAYSRMVSMDLKTLYIVKNKRDMADADE